MIFKKQQNTKRIMHVSIFDDADGDDINLNHDFSLRYFDNDFNKHTCIFYNYIGIDIYNQNIQDIKKLLTFYLELIIMIKALTRFFKKERCPQCKSTKIIRRNIQKKYIKGYDKHNYYCCNCGMSFDRYIRV